MESNAIERKSSDMEKCILEKIVPSVEECKEEKILSDFL
jgi:hypothetical protein